MDRTTRSRQLGVRQEARPPTNAQGAAAVRLDEHWLWLAWLAWVAVAGLTVGIFVASVAVVLAQAQALCPTAACAASQLTPDQLRALQQHDVTPSVYVGLTQALGQFGLTFGQYVRFSVALDIVGALVYAVVAVLILWRKSNDLLGLFISLTLLTFGVAAYPVVSTALAQASPRWWLPTAFVVFLGTVSIVLFFMVFPDGRLVPRWMRWVALVWIGVAIPAYLAPPQLPLNGNNWPFALKVGILATLLGLTVYGQVYRYRQVSNARQRMQTKWIVFGIVVALLTQVGVNLALAVQSPGLATYSVNELTALLIGNTVARLSFLVVPVTIGIAVLRHQLFDIDLIIKRTLVYSVLLATLVTLYEIGATVFERVLVALTGQSSLAADVAVAFFVGSLAEPLRVRIQRGINRLVFPRKYEADRRIEAFSKQLRRELDVETMSEQVEEEIKERIEHAWTTLRPHSAQQHGYVQEQLFI